MCVTQPTETFFAQAARVFDGWTDLETGVRVLRIFRRGEAAIEDVWQTLYQQCPCFLDGGRSVLLRTGMSYSGWGGKASYLLDLTTGDVTDPFPAGWQVVQVADATRMALLVDPQDRAVLWDLAAGAELAALPADGWGLGGWYFLGDGRRALAALYRGCRYDKPVQSRMYLLTPHEAPRLILSADDAYCSHMQGCPTDPELFSYDRWPTPKWDVGQVIHIRSLDGTFDEPLPLDDAVPRPGNFWGVRDHYVWTPDGRRIVSYFNPNAFTPSADFNHFALDWWLSATDWRTGEDLAAPYPPGRWGCHMQVTPDARYIVSAGGPRFDYLYAVEIDGLRQGWNEYQICAYPTTVSQGHNAEPFAFPVVLPDGSGVIFNAGWPGPEHGVYLAEWPAVFTVSGNGTGAGTGYRPLA